MNSQILSISGYTQKYLLSQLTKSLSRGDYQSASLWSVEMHISGWIVKWWIGIVSYCANYIHISNPKISKFLWKMSVEISGFYTNHLQLIFFLENKCIHKQKEV